MSQYLEQKVSILPSLHHKQTKFIRSRNLDPEDAPLKLTVEHGRRQFTVALKLSDDEHGDRISLRHLAEMVQCETGIAPKDQKYYWKGLTWKDPDMGFWSPSLKDLGVRNGDKIQLVSFHAPFPDYMDIEALRNVDQEMKQTLKEVALMVHKIHGIDLSCLKGSKLIALARTRKEVEDLKQKLCKHIEDLNQMHFHHLNCHGQAKRRELVDEAQRQLDKCTHFSTLIFHKLAQSHCLTNSGTLFPRDIDLKPPKRAHKAHANRPFAPCVSKNSNAWCARK